MTEHDLARQIASWGAKIKQLLSLVLQTAARAGSIPPVCFHFEGAAAADRFRQGYQSKVVRNFVRATIDAEDAPVGQAIIVTFLIDAVAQAQTVTLAAGSTNAEVEFGSTMTVEIGEVPGAKITQAGLYTAGNAPGTSVTVWLHEDKI